VLRPASLFDHALLAAPAARMADARTPADGQHGRGLGTPPGGRVRPVPAGPAVPVPAHRLPQPAGRRRRCTRPPRPVAAGTAPMEDDFCPADAGADVRRGRPAPDPEAPAAHLPHPHAPGTVPGRAVRSPRPRSLRPLPVHVTPLAGAVQRPESPAALLE